MQQGPMNHGGHTDRPVDRTTVIKEERPANGGTGQAPDQKEKGLFSDLSVPQVAAGALAAVTSMLLSNQIGIAGSVIGVAVGSVVSTVASSLYKRALARGANRIKEKIVIPGEESRATSGTGHSTATGHAQSVGDEAGTVTADGARIAPEALRERARARREHTVHKRVTAGVIAVSVVAAIVGVWLSAGFVTLATGGQGLGEKVSVIRTSKPSETDSKSSAEKDQKADSATGATDKNVSTSKDTGSTTGSNSSTGAGQNPADAGSSTGTSENTGSTGGSNGQGTGNNQGGGTDNQGTTGSGSGQGGQSQGGSSTTGSSQGTGGSTNQDGATGTGAAAQSQSGTASNTGSSSAS